MVERVGPYLTSASSASRRVICPPHKVCEGVGLGDLAEPSSGLPHRLRVRFWVINPSASSGISTVNSEPSVNRVTACLRLVCSSNCLTCAVHRWTPFVAVNHPPHLRSYRYTDCLQGQIFNPAQSSTSQNCLVRQAFPPSPFGAFRAVLYSAGAGWVASIRASI